MRQWKRAMSITLVGAVLPFAAATSARAQTSPAPAASTTAQDHYTAGRESYRQGLFGRALEEFERSLAMAPSPNTRLYIARSLRELGRLQEAAEQYRTTMREAEERGGKYVEARDAAELELRDVTVRIERSEPKAAPAKGTETPAASVSPEPPRTPATTSGPTTLTWISGGVAVAGAASFGVLYALASDRYSYLEDRCTVVRDAACESARTTGKTEEIVAYASLGVAAVFATVAVLSLTLKPSSRSSTAAGLTTPWRIAF